MVLGACPDVHVGSLVDARSAPSRSQTRRLALIARRFVVLKILVRHGFAL